MNIKIIANDYVQPTEVRENVVQTLCNVILEDYLDKNTSIAIYPKNAELYIGTFKGNRCDTTTPFLITRSTLNKNYDYTRIHSCEMEEVFKVIQDAGYHIYLERDKKARDSHYRFSKKPVFEGIKSKILEFDVFID
jgi:hypothetical protein